MTYFIGDIHANFGVYEKITSAFSPTMQLGDMGLGFGVDYEFPDLHPEHGFIRGNHDNPEICRTMESYLGDYGYLHGEDIFFVSGAFSIDKNWRTIGVDWWAEEELNHEQWKAVFELYGGFQPRIVATHDCPFSVLGEVQDSRFGSSKRTLTGMGLQQMLDIHQPEIWVFAHHHQYRAFTQGKTLFVALGDPDVWNSDTKERET